MKEMGGMEEAPEINYSLQFEELTYKEREEEMVISKLSAGYQSLLWMIMDLACRVCLLNPELKDRSEISGIVLIDEVDMHLHPKWQWNIVKALSATFEKVQFIIATHSPIVISSAKDANLIFLDGNHQITYLPDCYGYTVEDVLRFRQESAARPKQVRVLIDGINEALDAEKPEEAERFLAQLKEVLGEDNSEYRKMSGMITDARMIWES